MTHEPKCEKHKKYVFEGCPIDICEDITLSVPVSINAHSEVCEVKFECAGHTIEEVSCDENSGYTRFNVVQKINVRIPLKFKAECDVKEADVDFCLHECSKH